MTITQNSDPLVQVLVDGFRWRSQLDPNDDLGDLDLIEEIIYLAENAIDLLWDDLSAEDHSAYRAAMAAADWPCEPLRA